MLELKNQEMPLCACGCGQNILLQQHHKRYGIPKFIRGHNGKLPEHLKKKYVCKGKIVQHHEKYLEIHGEDKIILMTASKHRLLHLRIRKEGKCKIPFEKLSAISTKAHYRTEYHKKKCAEQAKNYRHNMYRFFDLTHIAPYIQLRIDTIYNQKTGNVCIWSCFQVGHGKKLIVVNI